jgi:predicted RNase H-like HicB family nuclease
MGKLGPYNVEQLETYILPVEIEEEADGRWSAEVSALPGCAVWAYSKEEVLKAIKEAAHAYIETLIEQRLAIPGAKEIEVKEAPVVSVIV